MNVTATTRGDRYTKEAAGQLEKNHNEHDPERTHSNKTIQPDETKMNQHVMVNGTLEQTLNDVWGPEIDKYNDNLKLQLEAGKLSTYNYKNRLRDVDSYTGGTKQPVMGFIGTLGNVETTRTIMDRLNIHYEMRDYINEFGDKASEPHVLPEDQKRWSKFCNDSFDKYVNWINDNTRFVVPQYWTHLDEGGAPHVHFEGVCAGHTKGGKLSQNSNNAVRETLEDHNIKPTKDNRENFSKFRKLTDNALVDSFNQVAKAQGYDLHLDLIRTGRPGGQSMADYKKTQAQKSAVGKAKQKNDARSELLAKQEADLADRKKKFQDEKKVVNNTANSLIELANRKHGAEPVDNVEDAASLIDDWVKHNHDYLVDMGKEYQRLEQKLQQQRQTYNQRKAQLSKREALVTSRENELKTIQQQLDALTKQRKELLKDVTAAQKQFEQENQRYQQVRRNREKEEQAVANLTNQKEALTKVVNSLQRNLTTLVKRVTTKIKDYFVSELNKVDTVDRRNHLKAFYQGKAQNDRYYTDEAKNVSAEQLISHELNLQNKNDSGGKNDDGSDLER